tara:strand:- start:189 stop:488 length:300 start_codon:yes stop_codon:yes gene_type:complete
MARPYTKVDQCKNVRQFKKDITANEKELTQDILNRLNETDRNEISGKFYTAKRTTVIKDWIDTKILKSLVSTAIYNKALKRVEFDKLTFTEIVRKVKVA